MTDTDRLTVLHAARDRLIDAMSGELSCRSCGRGVDPPLAAVVRELRATLAEIDAQSGPQEESTIERLRDDLAAKRERRATAAGP